MAVENIELLPSEESERRALSSDEVSRLLQAARRHRDPKMYPRIAMLLNTGLRPAEFWSMRWKQVDLEKRVFRILVNKRGAGKTRKNHVLPLNGAMVELLTELRRSSDPDGEDLIFGIAPGQRDQRRRNRKAKAARGTVGGVVYYGDYRFGAKLKEIAVSAEISEPETITPYILRHTFATAVLRSGANDVMAARLMKHTDLRMIKRYTHPEMAEMAEAVDRLHES